MKDICHSTVVSQGINGAVAMQRATERLKDNYGKQLEFLQDEIMVIPPLDVKEVSDTFSRFLEEEREKIESRTRSSK